MNSTSILTVSELTRSIKFNLESKFPDIQVQGEISNFKTQSSGHYYFSLKDNEAQIAAVMFRSEVQALKKIPKDGDHVVIKGAMNVYGPSGRYQIVVRSLEYAGLGALLLKLEELKIKLNRMGYFKPERRKPLPKFPKIIGVITSPTGAVIQDIINVLNRRHKGFHIILYPVKVQGEGSAKEIADAITTMNKLELVDVMIVGRGGGSIEDLWSFNEEDVANAIFKSRIPIISAVGHETDHTIADYVADVRAPTPSAAAEIVLQESANLLKQLLFFEERIKQSLISHLKHEKQKLNGFLRLPCFSAPYALLGDSFQKLDHYKEDFDSIILSKIKAYKIQLEFYQKQLEMLKPSTHIKLLKEKLIRLNKNINTLFESQIKSKKQDLNQVIDILKAIDPKNLLGKGYTILFSEKDGSVIKSVKKLTINDEIRLLLQDGSATSVINEIVPK